MSSSIDWPRSYKIKSLNCAKIFFALALLTFSVSMAFTIALGFILPSAYVGIFSIVCALKAVGLIGYFSQIRICTETDLYLIAICGVLYITIGDD